MDGSSKNSQTSRTNFTPVNIHDLSYPRITHVQTDSLTTGDTGETLMSFFGSSWLFPPPFGGKKKLPICSFFCENFGEGGGGERCAAARLGSSLCQGYKQAVIRPPNRIILPVSAPKHMGPHKAAAAPDRHPLLITQRRGAGPFLPAPFPASVSLCLPVEEIHAVWKEEAHVWC